MSLPNNNFHFDNSKKTKENKQNYWNEKENEQLLLYITDESNINNSDYNKKVEQFKTNIWKFVDYRIDVLTNTHPYFSSKYTYLYSQIGNFIDEHIRDIKIKIYLSIYNKLAVNKKFNLKKGKLYSFIYKIIGIQYNWEIIRIFNENIQYKQNKKEISFSELSNSQHNSDTNLNENEFLDTILYSHSSQFRETFNDLPFLKVDFDNKDVELDFKKFILNNYNYYLVMYGLLSLLKEEENLSDIEFEYYHLFIMTTFVLMLLYKLFDFYFNIKFLYTEQEFTTEEVFFKLENVISMIDLKFEIEEEIKLLFLYLLKFQKEELVKMFIRIDEGKHIDFFTLVKKLLVKYSMKSKNSIGLFYSSKFTKEEWRVIKQRYIKLTETGYALYVTLINYLNPQEIENYFNEIKKDKLNKNKKLFLTYLKNHKDINTIFEDYYYAIIQKDFYNKEKNKNKKKKEVKND